MVQQENVMRKYEAVFASQGALAGAPRTVIKEVKRADPVLAVGLALAMRASGECDPYGFRFLKTLSHPPVPDGEGGFLEVVPKRTNISPIYYFDPTIMTYPELALSEEDGHRKAAEGMLPVRCAAAAVVRTRVGVIYEGFDSDSDSLAINRLGEVFDAAENYTWKEEWNLIAPLSDACFGDGGGDRELH